MLDETARQGAPLVIELIPDPQEGGFTARLPDIPAYGEGETEEQAIADLQEALKGYIAAFGIDDAMSRLVSPQIRPVDWDLKGLVRA
jgi:predicted RNase H-like HicB family nuclease